MSRFRYDLHIHSCLSPCADADMTPCNIAGMAHLCGLELVALTDHNAVDNCPAFFRACASYGIVPIAGAELTTAEEIHLLCVFETLQQALAFGAALQPHRMRVKNRVAIFGEQTICDAEDRPIGQEPYFLPAATTLDLAAAVQLVEAHQGVCWPAHIDREANGILAILGAFPPTPAFRFAEVHDASKAALAEGRTVLVCSDAHRLWELQDDAPSIELPCEKGDAAAVTTALFHWLREGSK